MSRRSRLLDLYRGAAIQSGTASALGKMGAQISSNIGLQHNEARATRLADLIKKGQLTESQLSPSDALLLGTGTGTGTGTGLHGRQDTGGGGGILGDIGGFFSNLFGRKGLAGAVVGLPQGIEQLGSAFWHDFSHGTFARPGHQSAIGEKILKPLAQSYSYQYGPLVHGHLGEFAHRFYNAPLQPLLDVATVASLGAGAPVKLGSIATRAGGEGSRLGEIGQRLSQVNARTGRAPVRIESGIAGKQLESGVVVPPAIPRFYSASPLRRLFQGPVDRAIASGRLGSMAKSASENRALRKYLDTTEAGIKMTEAQNIGIASRPIAASLARLSYPEQEALMLLKRGISTPERLQQAQELWNKSLRDENPQGFNVGDPNFVGAQAQAEHLANLPDEVKQFMWNPTDRMVDASSQMDRYIAADIGPGGRLGISPEEHLERSYAIPQALTGRPAAELAAEASGHTLRYEPGHVDTSGGFEHPLHGRGYLDLDTGRIFTDYESGPTHAQQARYLNAHRGVAFYIDGKKGEIVPAPEAPASPEVLDYIGREVGLPVNHKKYENYELALPEQSQELKLDQTIKPNYTPDIVSHEAEFAKRGLNKLPLRGKLADLATRRLGYSGEPELKIGPSRRIMPETTTAENLYDFEKPNFLRDTELAAFKSGAFRSDARAFLSHIAQREKFFVNEELRGDQLSKVSLKDENGIDRYFKTQQEVDHATGKRGEYVLVHPGAAVKWFRAERNVMEQVKKTVDRYAESRGPANVDELNRAIQTLTETNADFTLRQLGAVKGTGVAVPREVFSRMLQHARVGTPFEGGGLIGKSFNLWAKALNHWRSWTLAMMPRWMVNTAVGSFLLNTIAGTVPMDYLTAARLIRKHRNMDDPFHLPPGVQQGTLASETLEAGSAAANLGRVFGRASPARFGFHATQAVEDYFRTANFVHQLNRVGRERMGQVGQILDGYQPITSRILRGEDDINHVKALIEDPEQLKMAMEDVNKFSYNWAQMGPQERRYVRQFVPFWGWYKFITRFIWSLPVSFPGRAKIVTSLGNIGRDFQDQMGELPPWLQQSILLNTNKHHLKYLPTFGLNPLAQFATPFAPEGRASGLFRLGQFAPPIQAGLSAMGIDPMTGAQVAISPAEGIGHDFLGRPVDTRSGRVLSTIGEVAGGRRFLGELARSIPQVRLGELKLTGGRTVYPESIPLLAERPRGVRPEARRNVGGLGFFAQYWGATPRGTNLARWQGLNKKSVQYGRTTINTQQRKLKYRLSQP